MLVELSLSYNGHKTVVAFLEEFQYIFLLCAAGRPVVFNYSEARGFDAMTFILRRIAQVHHAVCSPRLQSPASRRPLESLGEI